MGSVELGRGVATCKQDLAGVDERLKPLHGLSSRFVGINFKFSTFPHRLLRFLGVLHPQ